MRKLLAGLMLSLLFVMTGCSSGTSSTTDPNAALPPVTTTSGGYYPTDPGYQQQPGYDSNYYGYSQTGYDPLTSLAPGRYIVSSDASNTVLGQAGSAQYVCQSAVKNQYSPFYMQPVYVCDWDGQYCWNTQQVAPQQLCGY